MLPATICQFPSFATPLEGNESNYYISVSSSTKGLSQSFSASKTDVEAKWFDDFPSSNHSNIYEMGAKLPYWDLTLDYRNRSIDGLHKGVTSKRVKIGLFYAWVDGSIVSGLASNDTVKYSFDFHQLALGKQYVADRFFLTPKLGISAINANLSLSGAGSTEQKSGLVPLPFIGFVAGGKLTEALKIELDSRYSKFSSGGTTANHRETLLALTYDVNKYLTISAGKSDFLFQLDFAKYNSIASLKLAQASPFIRLALRY